MRVNEDENLDAQREKFFNFQHEADNDYIFFAELKLTEMFPKVSLIYIYFCLTQPSPLFFSDFNRQYSPNIVRLSMASDADCDQFGRCVRRGVPAREQEMARFFTQREFLRRYRARKQDVPLLVEDDCRRAMVQQEKRSDDGHASAPTRRITNGRDVAW